MSPQLSLLEPNPVPMKMRPLAVGARVWARRGYLTSRGPLEPATVIEVATASRFTVRFERDGWPMDLVVATYGPSRWIDREPTEEERKA